MTGSFYLGVDGGGTKTTFVLIDSNRNIIAEHAGGSSYHLQVGIVGLRNVLANGIEAVTKAAGIGAHTITYSFFGLPAYGEDMAFDPRIATIPKQLLGHDRYTCGNDMICGWAGSFGGDDGINILAGTGSIGYGERRGVSARAGGWGEVFSDEGSAYSIAVRALNLFTRMSDGRSIKGPLYHILKAHFELQNDLHICGKIMSYGFSTRDEIAQLSMLVMQAAQEGDHRAVAIFSDAARDLFDIVDTIRRTLQFDVSETVPVSYSGGVFNAGDFIKKPFEAHLRAKSLSYKIIEPKFSPSTGAALYAAKLGVGQAH
jgi:N-acetylglucosamine kinase-like BadF-type ATPase